MTNSSINTDFGAIKLEQPLFYNSEYALRFEIGPDEEDIWNDEQISFNERYFNVALERSLSIFHNTFDANDEVTVVYQVFSDGRRKIRKRNFLFRQISDIQSKSIIFSQHKDIYCDDLDYEREHWHRATIGGLRKNDINIEAIFKSQINTDFGSRGSYLKGECYILNVTKSIVLNLYDDRGMDVVSTSKSNLAKLYKEQNSVLLDYDRARMDIVFGSGQG
jgi:hypothetical protein